MLVLQYTLKQFNMKTLKKNNISQGSPINSPVTVNKNCDLPPFFNTDYFSHVVVQTLEELESIPCKLRQDGMVATVVQDGYSDYQLQTSRTGFGICDNNAWVKISIGDEVFNGGNLFLFQTEEQANEFMGSTQSKEGQIIYISDLDSYFKFDGQDSLTDAFPNKLDKPTVQGLDNPNYKIPAYLDGKPYWRSSSDFEKVKSVNGKTGDVILKTSDLENDSDYTTNSKLNKEVQDRITQINNIEQKLQTEKFERISEDDILNYKIDTTKTELNTNFDAKLSQESTLRQNQDAVLDNKITTEKTDRINADNLKLDKPTTTGSTISHPNIVGVDDLGNSAKIKATDFGKVKSVNGKEGDVILKTSDLENDSDYTTNATLTAHTSNKANPHNVTKEQIGLGNVDNTSDLNKPISTATQTELNKKLDKPTTNNTPDYVLLADGSTAPKSDFGKVNSVNGINPDNNKNNKVGINEILKEYQPNIVADKNKKVLLFDEYGKTYYFSLGNIITNTSVDESLFVNVDNLLGVNTTSAITEKVINSFENITYPIDISLDYNYTEISDIFINSCLKLPRDYYYIISNNRIKIKDFSDLINTENWEKLFIEITGTKNTNYEQ